MTVPQGTAHQQRRLSFGGVGDISGYVFVFSDYTSVTNASNHVAKFVCPPPASVLISNPTCFFFSTVMKVICTLFTCHVLWYRLSWMHSVDSRVVYPSAVVLDVGQYKQAGAAYKTEAPFVDEGGAMHGLLLNLDVAAIPTIRDTNLSLRRSQTALVGDAEATLMVDGCT